MKSKMMQNRLFQSVSEFWNFRSERERRFLSIGAIALLAVLFYMLLIDPALEGRADLRRRLPQLREQVVQLQSLSSETKDLPRESTVISVPVSREAIAASLNSRSLNAQNLAVTGDTVRLQLAGASFSSLVDWLSEMQRTMLLTVTEANIVAQAQPDTVNATLMLRQQKSE